MGKAISGTFNLIDWVRLEDVLSPFFCNAGFIQTLANYARGAKKISKTNFLQYASAVYASEIVKENSKKIYK